MTHPGPRGLSEGLAGLMEDYRSTRLAWSINSLSSPPREPKRDRPSKGRNR